MICTMCEKELPSSDFLLKQTKCYRCIYDLKTRKVVVKKITKKNYCRTCGDEILFDDKSKKRQRNVFCSENCAIIGHREKSNNHWTRKIRKIIPLYPQINFVA